MGRLICLGVAAGTRSRSREPAPRLRTCGAGEPVPCRRHTPERRCDQREATAVIWFGPVASDPEPTRLLPSPQARKGDQYVGLALIIAGTVAYAVMSGGGFDASSRATFVALAGACLIVASAIDVEAAVRAARSPLALALVAVAAISLASAAWTVGSSAAAVRWGLVIAGYAAVLIATATLGEANGALLVAAGIAALALLEAVLGVHAVAFHALPQAERLGRVWRPAGTFEYPPALALLQVGALPVLSSAIGDRRAPVASAATAAATLAGVVLGVAGSRLALALAGMLLATLVLWPPTGRRSTAVTTVCCVVIGGLAGRVVLEASVGPAAPGVGWGGAGEIAALALAAGSLRWILPRARVSGAGLVVGLCFAVVALAIFASISGGKRTQRAPRQARSQPADQTSCTVADANGRRQSRPHSNDRFSAPVPALTTPPRFAVRPPRARALHITFPWNSQSSSESSDCCLRWRSTRRPPGRSARRCTPRRCGCSRHWSSRFWYPTCSIGPGSWRVSDPSGQPPAAPCWRPQMIGAERRLSLEDAQGALAR